MKPKTADQAPPFLISAKMAKALANEWRNKILTELHLVGPMSPKEFAEQIDGPELGVISRHFRQLRGWGLIEIAEERRGGKRRGAVEKVYRAIQRVHFDTATWETLPLHLREEHTGTLVEALIRRIAQASQTGTLDADTDNHISWRPASLDRQAWTEYNTQLDDDLDRLSKLEAESALRVAKSGEEPIFATSALLMFRSPKPSEVKRSKS